MTVRVWGNLKLLCWARIDVQKRKNSMFQLVSKRLQLREIAAEDLAALLPIYSSNPEFVEQNEGSESEPGRYDLARWQRDWTIMQMLPGNHQLGCYLRSDSTPVGILYFLEENEEDGKPWLGTLVIHRDHQRQGLGSEALSCLIEHLRQQGWSVLRAGINVQNQRGFAFLSAQRFSVVKETQEVDGVPTLRIMERAL